MGCKSADAWATRESKRTRGPNLLGMHSWSLLARTCSSENCRSERSSKGFTRHMKQLVWLGVLSLLTACSKDSAAPAQSPVEPNPESAAAGVAATSPEPAPDSPPANEIDLLSLFGAQIQVATDLPVS